MAYNNYFPVSYAPAQYYPNFAQMQPQQPTQQQQPAQPSSNLIWVQGEAGMKAYLVAPNTTVTLWDSEKAVIYLKSADASGMPSVKILDYTIRAETASTAPTSGVQQNNTYITKADYEALNGEIKSLRADIDELKKREVKDGE